MSKNYVTSESSKKTLYIFGRGGTGSRVLKAMTLLLASGCQLEGGFSQIVPIIIDPDKSNGDLNRTKHLMRLYQEIRSEIEEPSDFFQQEISSIENIENDESKSISEHNFQWDLKDVDSGTFEDYIKFQTLNSDEGNNDQNFVKLFYSQKNLDSSLNVGFKGNPNMGVVVLNQITESDQFRNFAKGFNDGDAIFIINSIFGGTGAAGLPLLLKNIRKNEKVVNYRKIRDSKVGAITFLPYFSVDNKTDADNEIKSETFDEKAKVALSYYNRTIINNNELNAIYFIGNKTKGKNYVYSVGGESQKNHANFLELIGALSIFDFCSNEYFKDHDKTVVKEFGLKKTYSNVIDLFHLDDSTRNKVEEHLAKFKVFSDYLTSKYGLSKAKNVSRWTKNKLNRRFPVAKSRNSTLTESFFDSPEFSTIESFVNYFNRWIKEMEDNNPSFIPFRNKSSQNQPLDILSNDKTFNSKRYKLLDQSNNRFITKKEIIGSKKEKTLKYTILIRLFEHSLKELYTKNRENYER